MFLPKAIIADNTSLTQAQINILLNRADQAYISGNYQEAIAAEQQGDLSAPQLWQRVKRDRTSAWDAAEKAIGIRENSKSIARVEALLQMAKLA
ncbi:MAG: hypothetical protein HC930_09180 [Hydrococcus sp. SU_1_0]|nr:hypothetical protein [Hydrococcus sp. SU_1_0]